MDSGDASRASSGGATVSDQFPVKHLAEEPGAENRKLTLREAQEDPMKSTKETRAQLALVSALGRNRGELDAATLERLLRLVGALKPAAPR